MLLLDTDDLLPGDRADAYRAMAVAEAGACGIEHQTDTGHRFHKRLAAWKFGPVTLFSNQGSGMRYWQTPRHLRQDSWNTVSIITQVRGEGGFAWNGQQRSLTRRDLAIASKSTGPWECRWSGTGESLGLMVEADRLGLPDRLIRAVLPHARYSEITPLLLTHFLDLKADADRLSADPGADALGEAALALIRALIASATPGSTRRQVADETRLTRVLAYIRAHLTDPYLTGAQVAAAHNLTTPALDLLCEEHGIDLGQWITQRRLQGAHRDLTAPAHAHRSIDVIAHSWGFTDPVQFARTFHDAYGTTPHVLRAAHQLSDSR
ncbi:helix-turn-helix domain-containing protein [Streptomyces sp. NPDC060322]|uniref:helix-turn-helix domain-containing protein n=1 Tax=Streptomyces sp. NPDC060322 TaxID=3347097 RepID=UPI0036614487